MTSTALTTNNSAFLDMGQRLFSESQAFGLFCKDIVQGLLSGLMMIAGSTQLMTGEAIATLAAFPPVLDSAFLQDVLSGRTMGGLEVIVAALLFFSARRGLARTIGVLALVGYLAFQNMGLTGADLLTGASNGLRTLADSLEAAGMTPA